MQRAAEADSDRERISVAQVDLSGQSDIAVDRGRELVGERQIMSDVLKTVGRADVAAGALDERRRRAQRHPIAVLVRGQKLMPDDPRHVAGVVPSADREMRRKQYVKMESS